MKTPESTAFKGKENDGAYAQIQTATPQTKTLKMRILFLKEKKVYIIYM